MNGDVYNETLRAIEDSRYSNSGAADGGGGKWLSWVQIIVAVGTIVVSVVLAYAALDKRISLIEFKLDQIIYQNSSKHGGALP